MMTINVSNSLLIQMLEKRLVRGLEEDLAADRRAMTLDCLATKCNKEFFACLSKEDFAKCNSKLGKCQQDCQNN